MNELSTLTARIDALAIGLRDVAKGWQERFGLIEREVSQNHSAIRDLHETAELAKRRRAVNTRITVALIMVTGTIANGTLQVIGSKNRGSLRAEILTQVHHDNDELVRLAANAAVEANNRRLELLIKAPK